MSTITRTRATAAVAALGLLLVVPTATAAPRKPPPPSCNLVQDPADVPESPSLDVLSADVATNATTLTSVIRVKSLAAGNDPRTAAGQKWLMSFRVDQNTILLNAMDGVAGPRASGAEGRGVVTLNKTKHEVRYTIPLKWLTSPIIPGKTILSGFTVTTRGHVDTVKVAGFDLPPTGETTAVSTKAYKAGAKSCVTVG